MLLGFQESRRVGSATPRGHGRESVYRTFRWVVGLEARRDARAAGRAVTLLERSNALWWACGSGRRA